MQFLCDLKQLLKNKTGSTTTINFLRSWFVALKAGMIKKEKKLCDGFFLVVELAWLGSVTHGATLSSF